uniref:Reverse transcriptase Ty1/copia-type domain-containing protein n=1 Tax=Cannabis sativa TaxID=3483 RepID=A0A803Q997_CANSA
MGSSLARFDLERFDGTDDFCLWKEKMLAILIYQKLDSALDEDLGSNDVKKKDMDESKKKESDTIMKQARSSIFMHLADNVLRQVIGEKTTLGIWSKLNQLYMARSTVTKIFLKGKFYGFKMNATVTLDQNLDELNKIVLALTNMGGTIKEEDQAVIMLNALPDQFKEMRTVIMYSRDTLTLDDVMSTLRSRDAELNWQRAAKQESRTADALMVRGRVPRRGNSRFRGNSRSNSSNNDSNAVIEDSDRDVLTITNSETKVENSIDGDVCTSSCLKDQDWIMDTQVAAVDKCNSESKLWHARFGHIGEQGLVELSKQGLLLNYTHANLPFCEICVQGKQHRIKFLNSNYRAKSVLEYIHADLWGASRVKTQGDPDDGVETLDGYQLAQDRARREIRPPAKYAKADIIAYALSMTMESQDKVPKTYLEAINSKQAKKWNTAMNSKMQSLKKDKTWVVVLKLEGQKVIGSKWIFRHKEGLADDEPILYKARLLAQGFTQVEGVDYSELFSPVVKMKTIRMMLALAVQFDWNIEQMDVKTAFLNGRLEETIYMKQPDGFKVEFKDGELVCLLKRSLYGLKHSPREWYKKFDSVLTKVGYSRSKYDLPLFHKSKDTSCYIPNSVC